MINKICVGCSAIYVATKPDRKYCSSSCFLKYRNKNNNPMWNRQSQLKSSESHRGQHSSLETEIKKGEHFSQLTEIKSGQHLSKRTEFVKGQTPWNKGVPYPQIQGEKHFNWVGGKKGYRGKAWYYIRQQVLIRDNYKCQICGAVEGLHVHHIIPYRLSHDNSLINLVTLCRSHHTKTESNFSMPCPIMMSVMVAGEP